MTTMLTEAEVQLMLAVLGLAAFSVVLALRLRMSHHLERRDMGRLILIDALLVVAAIELVADAFDELGVDQPWHDAARAVAFACRGALVAGAFALVATINEAERTRRA